MKRNSHPSLYNADNPPTDPNKESSTADTKEKSPYLKAILSGTKKMFISEKSLPELNADHLAALRYIKDSALIKKIYTGKMSC